MHAAALHTTVQSVVNRFLATVLLGAAASKAFFSPVASQSGVFSSSAVLASVVALEVVAAAWLLCLAGTYPRITRVGGTILFGTFAIYSLFSWLRGVPCHCFGQTGISPLVPLAIDLAAIALLWLPGLIHSQSGARPQTWAAQLSAKNAGGGRLRGLRLPHRVSLLACL
jgi:hypothetical protein